MAAAWSLVDRSDGQMLVEDLTIAQNPWQRLCGWQFKPRMPANAGLLLVPCSSIHTCFLRFELDLLWLDRQGAVLSQVLGVQPWRLAFAPKGTWGVLELPSGSLDVDWTGRKLQLAPRRAPSGPLPSRLRPLA